MATFGTGSNVMKEPLRCAMTGNPLADGSEGVYDDGEWISWEWINDQLPDAESAEDIEGALEESATPTSVLALAEVLLELTASVARYRELTGRYLEIWGELGELYAEVRHGLIRHPKHQAGSDGTIGGVLVEVKTISPEKKSDRVVVKRAGDFEKLLIVRISEDLWFSSTLIDRSQLSNGTGATIKARWRVD